MTIKKKVILLGIQLVLVGFLAFVLPLYPQMTGVYDKCLYYPLQYTRDLILGFIPFSIGDVVYVLGGLLALATSIRWGYYVIHWRVQRVRLGVSVLSAINVCLFIYIFFILGWGANYYKAPLRETWEIKAARTDSVALIRFSTFLVEKLNATAPYYTVLTFSEANKWSVSNYRACSDSKVKSFGLMVKPTLFGYFMERLSIEGYYNPFTGEGQVCTWLPSFMRPFVISHEMAHQAGIAAEGDANLMAYAIGTVSSSPSFQYSAYFNLWLYAYNRLYRRDSATAQRLKGQLNQLTLAHIDTMDELNKMYDNDASRYGSELYDGYLKMHKQKDGIRSYGNVVTNARLLEEMRQKGMTGLIHVP